MADFEGHAERECGEHRTLGARAWCYDCRGYCYPDRLAACAGCLLPWLLADPVIAARVAELGGT